MSDLARTSRLRVRRFLKQECAHMGVVLLCDSSIAGSIAVQCCITHIWSPGYIANAAIKVFSANLTCFALYSSSLIHLHPECWNYSCAVQLRLANRTHAGVGRRLFQLVRVGKVPASLCHPLQIAVSISSNRTWTTSLTH